MRRILRGEEGYPSRLQRVHRPPEWIYVLGELPPDGDPVVAIVGSRAATRAGGAFAEELAAELARAGIVVVSGLARGIDAAAHRGALAGGGRTVAVVGCGLDVPYPREHAELKRRIVASGAILSEYAPGTPPLAHHFPRRNRLLAGLSDAVVVVEAGGRSGALVTARWALDMGREVLVVPRAPWDPNSEGVLRLLRDGAAPVCSAADVEAALPLPGSRPALESRLLGILAQRGRATVEEMLEAVGCGVAATQLLAALGRLEIEGRIRCARGVYTLAGTGTASAELRAASGGA
jgi:DNA processing protein